MTTAPSPQSTEEAIVYRIAEAKVRIKRELAKVMVRLGEDAGVATRAVLTNMNVPLGLAIGNANEVRVVRVVSGVRR